jgi:hypothetical protein
MSSVEMLDRDRLQARIRGWAKNLMIDIKLGREGSARPLMDEGIFPRNQVPYTTPPAGKFPAFTLRPDCEQYACHVQFISGQVGCNDHLKRKQKDSDLRANMENQ